MATTAQIDAALDVLRAARFILAKSITAQARAVLVRDKAIADVVTADAARAAAETAEDVAKASAITLLSEVEI